jgi:hypothetical protein
MWVVEVVVGVEVVIVVGVEVVEVVIVVGVEVVEVVIVVGVEVVEGVPVLFLIHGIRRCANIYFVSMLLIESLGFLPNLDFLI